MIFLDANVFIYAIEDSGSGAGRLISALRERAISAATSVAVIEELWHVEQRDRAGHLGGATVRIYELMTPLLGVTDDIIAGALALDAPVALGTNDRVHAATCFAHGIDQIVSGDQAFDEITGLERINPLEPDQISMLLV